MQKHSAPIIAAMLLLMPVLYVGSYFALVEPGDYDSAVIGANSPARRQFVKGYRFEGDPDSFLAGAAPFLFWPLEQTDRRLRRGAWEPADDPFLRSAQNGKNSFHNSGRP